MPHVRVLRFGIVGWRESHAAARRHIADRRCGGVGAPSSRRSRSSVPPTLLAIADEVIE